MVTITIMKKPVDPPCLAEKYRPKRLSQILGQDKAVAKVQHIIKRRGGKGGFALWISGKPGQGKTTIARCVARQLAASIFVTEQDAGELTEDDITRIRNTWATKSIDCNKEGRVWIFNEAHGLKPTAARALLVLLESGDIPPHCTVIFTTTAENMEKFADKYPDTKPLLDRCGLVKLTSQGLAPVFARLSARIARREGLNGRPESAYLQLVNESAGSMRAVLQRIDDGEMSAT